MKKCPFCAEEIQDKAVVCKHCGRDLAGGRSASAAQLRTDDEKKKANNMVVGCLGCVGLIVLLSVAMGLMTSGAKSGAGPSGATVGSEAKARAIVACETALRNQYRLAIDVSPFNAEYNVKEYVTIVRGEDELPDGRMVNFRCKFSPDGTLVSAEAH